MVNAYTNLSGHLTNNSTLVPLSSPLSPGDNIWIFCFLTSNVPAMFIRLSLTLLFCCRFEQVTYSGLSEVFAENSMISGNKVV